MARQTPQYLCEFWNCHEGGDMPAPFTVSTPGDPGQRKRFCSAAHAALWCVKEAFMLQGSSGGDIVEQIGKELSVVLEVKPYK